MTLNMSIYYEGLRMYNKLPRKIKNCTIMLKFKQLLRPIL
jgi:hypothetical protein